MIVIASHDEIELLDNLLGDLSSIDINGHDIVVVDTNSQSQHYIQHIDSIRLKFPQVQYLKINYDCWDTGAYINAYFQIRNKSKSYIFLQDSLRIANPNFIKMIDLDLDHNDIVSPFSFWYFYDNEEQRQWVERDLNCRTRPDKLIFGPIFAVNKTILDKLPKIWIHNSNPLNKITACGMERRWSLMFHLMNFKMKFYQDVTQELEPKFWESDMFFHKNIKKIFKRR